MQVYLFTSPCYDCCVTSEVEWARAADLKVQHQHDVEAGVRDADKMKLFEGRIEPADIMQGTYYIYIYIHTHMSFSTSFSHIHAQLTPHALITCHRQPR